MKQVIQCCFGPPKVSPQNFTFTSSTGLLSLSVIAMPSLADANCLSQADDSQECKQVVVIAIALGCKSDDLQAILES